MGVATDKSLVGLTTAVNNISTTGMSDTTGQAINSTLATLMTDTTGQAINTTLQSLVGSISPAAVNVTFDNTGTGLSASNVQAAIDEVNDLIVNDTASITRQSGVSSSTPIPTITRRGRVVIIHFAQQFPAGTYYDLYNVSPVPTGSQHAIVSIGNAQDLIYLSSDGKMRFNNSKTLNSSTYVIGQIVYLTD